MLKYSIPQVYRNPAFWVQKGQHMKWLLAHSEPSLGACFWALALSKSQVGKPSEGPWSS